MEINEEKFSKIVEEVLDGLPADTQRKLNNLAILVEDFPTREQMEKVGIKHRFGLLGLYEGHVQSSRLNVGVVLPDRITLFRVPIMQSCSTEEDCKKRIKSNPYSGPML